MDFKYRLLLTSILVFTLFQSDRSKCCAETKPLQLPGCRGRPKICERRPGSQKPSPPKWSPTNLGHPVQQHASLNIKPFY